MIYSNRWGHYSYLIASESNIIFTMSAMCSYDYSTYQSKVLEFINRTGYRIVQVNGQRITSPPAHLQTYQPQTGSEVFVGNLPRFVFEDELIPLFESVGPIYQFRLMMEFRGCNRGFAFVQYVKKDDANKAILRLNGYKVRPGAAIGVNRSVNNCRLFISGIPVEKTKAEVWYSLNSYIEGMADIIMYQSRENKNKNRGYIFVEFVSHKHASVARKLLSHAVVLWGVQLIVDWADVIPEVDPVIMSQVKKLYIRNICLQSSNRDLWLFLLKYVSAGSILRVSKTLDYAFVHFDSRRAAEQALHMLHQRKFCGTNLEVMWARPHIYSKEYRLTHPPKNTCRSVPPKMRRMITERTKRDVF